LVLRASKIKEAREITNPAFMRAADADADSRRPQDARISSTFHGRDIYGPAAAMLAKGIALSQAGPPAKDLVLYRISEPRQEGNTLAGEVDHIDWYGNLITNLPRALVEKIGVGYGRMLSVDVGTETLDAPFVRTYADASQG